MDRLKTRIRTNFKRVESVAAIISASSLAYHGLLTSVEMLTMCDVDLSKVPTLHLTALASCVENKIKIKNVTGCNPVSFLISIRNCELIEYSPIWKWEQDRHVECRVLMDIYLYDFVKDVETHDKTFVHLVNRELERVTEIISSPDRTQEDIDTAQHQQRKLNYLIQNATNHWDHFIYV